MKRSRFPFHLRSTVCSKNFEDGLILYIVNALVQCIKYLNIIEWLKWFAVKHCVAEATEERKKSIGNWTVDIFIFLKFIFVILLWWLPGLNGKIWEVIVWYLIISNVFTYFSHHIWDLPDHSKFSKGRRLNRFAKLMIAFIYSNSSFALLYGRFYQLEFSFLKNTVIGLDSAAVYLSFSNSVFSNLDFVTPLTIDAYLVLYSQMVISFILVSTILTVSIPQGGK